MTRSYENSVFINCPFDKAYRPILDAIIFAVIDCGYVPRLAEEEDNAGETRLAKLYNLIRQSKFGIHDISRTTLDPKSKTPRFNMPFELGVFFGARQFGGKVQRGKCCMVLDREKHRYQKFLSDINGMDIKAHREKVDGAVEVVQKWLSTNTKKGSLNSPKMILDRYNTFRKIAKDELKVKKAEYDDLVFNDKVRLILKWQSKFKTP